MHTEITLSRSQRLQVVTLVLSKTVVNEMVSEIPNLSKNADRTRKRICGQIDAMLADIPKYGHKTLGQLTRSINRVWESQREKSFDAVTMLFVCMWLVEGVRSAMRDVGRKPSAYSTWSRLAGSMFTLAGHIGDQWEDQNGEENLEACSLGKQIKKAA